MIKPNLPWRYALTPIDPTNVKYIVVHHIEAKSARIEDIDNWHKNNGWNGVGYNYYIRKDGSVYEGRGLNVGAHTLGYNEISVGVALEGDYQTEDNVPQTQFNALVELLKELKPQFPNLIEIGPHKKYCSTACPGKNFPFDAVIASLNEPVAKEDIRSSNPRPYIVDLCGQGISVQIYAGNMEVFLNGELQGIIPLKKG